MWLALLLHIHVTIPPKKKPLKTSNTTLSNTTKSVIKSDICFFYSKRSKKGDKNGKGLRHFSMKVCEKVQRKGTTSYNEVADELVSEFTNCNSHLATGSVSKEQSIPFFCPA